MDLLRMWSVCVHLVRLIHNHSDSSWCALSLHYNLTYPTTQQVFNMTWISKQILSGCQHITNHYLTEVKAMTNNVYTGVAWKLDEYWVIISIWWEKMVTKFIIIMPGVSVSQLYIMAFTSYSIILFFSAQTESESYAFLDDDACPDSHDRENRTSHL